ncbi:FAD-dependent pyridine nucleotide-disulfide oxidoreductase [Penicillium maclennaniae]|uniref:FAD-dependent pyridine nucleotide-disulfide oxidoreductase n=1 Tax=Penicillium maclennaniae TaxID=1343394 RepID=UPI002541971D|nr:FAD-dependent pyridine nucleotide-disulfide oxidoreductase [Penicillium maclennaniae]KAJ5677033.1 FAD-dependent pyridine nucleotide-disulfide oxidoreductase [Penicillium maclennaniae]
MQINSIARTYLNPFHLPEVLPRCGGDPALYPTTIGINKPLPTNHSSLRTPKVHGVRTRRDFSHHATQKGRHHRQVFPPGKEPSLSPTPPYNITGSGPSGLVTAKTLLHNFPHGTFAPVVFDSRHGVGGLWPNQAHGTPVTKASTPGTLDPWMRTNLSRFTVSFSDFSWESALGSADVPIFPQARQVGRYLAAYCQRYIPEEVLRLGQRVVSAVRSPGVEAESRWRISWVKESVHETDSSNDEVFSEDFDFLVVASGYFARPYIPDIPGLAQFTGQVIHSSNLGKSNGSPAGHGISPSQGNMAVIGGSLSGVEAASALALKESSSMCNPASRSQERARQAVYHIYSRPFWSLPTYLPHETADDNISFLPLDLALYDLSRRPPGPIEYALGLIPEDKAAKTNDYFNALLGTEYERYGHMNGANSGQKSSPRPPWVAIGNEYSEFVRSGTIKPTMGRAIAVHPDPDTGLASIKIETVDGQSMVLEKVSSIVLATGFTPFESLSFLPADVLAALEYSTEDPFLPLVLDKGGTFRLEVPDIGFVGFYRGPYWGIMEMQARFLGEAWTGQISENLKTEGQRENLRVLRQVDSQIHRGQFPMGDYVGLMESFSADLGITRTELTNGENQFGPVVPARYLHGVNTVGNFEVQQTLKSLQANLNPHHGAAQAAAALAIFRALHGSWQATQLATATGMVEANGTAVFHPRYPSAPEWDKEYVCEEQLEPTYKESGPTAIPAAQWIFRLSEAGTSHAPRIGVWAVDPENTTKSAPDVWLKLTPFYRKKKDGEYLSGEYVIYAQSIRLTDASDTTERTVSERKEYTFHFTGVSIASWESVTYETGISEGKSIAKDQRGARSRTVYER